MAVSKRLRFEVLRRDDFACRYCGARAPDIELTVDHVTPKALGGTDTADNLVAACQPCNAGKSSAGPDEHHVAQVADDALRWAAAVKQAAAEMTRQAEKLERSLDSFDLYWTGWLVLNGRKVDRFELPDDGEKYFLTRKYFVPRDPEWMQSIGNFASLGLPWRVIYELIDIAMYSPARPDQTWKYFCGCAWRAVAEMQSRAHELLQEGP